MAKQNNIHETNGALLELYFVSGRVCDCEDEFKLVSATSASEAEEIFEKYVRSLNDIEGNDFYIEHCQTISCMKESMLTIKSVS
jgi:hypothetical protein